MAETDTSEPPTAAMRAWACRGRKVDRSSSGLAFAAVAEGRPPTVVRTALVLTPVPPAVIVAPVMVVIRLAVAAAPAPAPAMVSVGAAETEVPLLVQMMAAIEPLLEVPPKV